MIKKNTYSKVFCAFIFLWMFLHSAFPSLNAHASYLASLDTAYTKTISLDFKDANLNDVLKIFSQQAGLNFVASSGIANRTINLYLDQVPVEAALERILSANNLTYEISPGSNIFVVKELKISSVQTLSRVYTLKHATVPTSKLNSTLSASAESAEDDSTEDAASAGIIAAIEAILTEDGSIIEDPRTNSIIVTDIPTQFPIIEHTIARLDIRIPQILIEVEMLDISQSTSDKLGAKFGDTPVEFAGGTRTDFHPFNNEKLLALSGGDSGAAKIARYTTSTVSFEGLQFIVNFIRSQGDTKNLARPRIMTLNNETAEIEIKTDEAIGVLATTTSTEGVGESVSQAERVETGVFLKVTPQANLQTGEITMAVEPKVIQARLGQPFGGSAFKDPEERGTKSLLRVRDGDTIILGGLLRTDRTKTETKVPIISSIPILGAAFRHKDETNSERELIVFITPHIIRDDYPTTQLSANNQDQFLREQHVPRSRLQKIDKELSYLENQRF